MQKNLLALDIGTQSAWAAMLTLDGEILGLRQVQHEVDGPHVGWAQQRPDDWWTETCQAIRDVLEATEVAARCTARWASTSRVA